MSASDLLSDGPKVLGVGLKGFIDDLESQKVPALAVDWKPCLLYTSPSPRDRG